MRRNGKNVGSIKKGELLLLIIFQDVVRKIAIAFSITDDKTVSLLYLQT